MIFGIIFSNSLEGVDLFLIETVVDLSLFDGTYINSGTEDRIQKNREEALEELIFDEDSNFNYNPIAADDFLVYASSGSIDKVIVCGLFVCFEIKKHKNDLLCDQMPAI